MCADGYGSTDIATCVLCPSRSVNTVYYILATLLTLVLLALAMHASIEEAEKLQREHEEEVERSEAEEREVEEAEEEEAEKHGPALPNNTMQGPHRKDSKLQPKYSRKKLNLGIQIPSRPAHSDSGVVTVVHVPVNSMGRTRPEDVQEHSTDPGFIGVQPSLGSPRSRFASVPNSMSTARSAPEHLASPPLTPRSQQHRLTVSTAAALQPPPSAATSADLGQLRASIAQQHSLRSLPPAAQEPPSLEPGNTMASRTTVDEDERSSNSMARRAKRLAKAALDGPVDSMSHPRANTPVRDYPTEAPREVEQSEEHPVRSHFFDHRDPILEDAQRALSVVLRIFVSYVQVRTLCRKFHCCTFHIR